MMWTPKTVDTQCPYCPVRNRAHIDDANSNGNQLITCDEDEGGCGKEYIVRISYQLTAVVFPLGDLHNLSQ